LWHHQLFPNEKNWHLLDHGHYGINEWKKNGLIPSEQYTPYDVFDKLEADLMQKFSVVITDPPWYLPYYGVFYRRTKELVKPGGFVGVSYYPRFDLHKYEKFQEIKSSNVPYELQGFGAMDIDYEVPEFERATSLHKQFEHRSLGIYRHGYIDFFLAPSEPHFVESLSESSEATFLPKIYCLPNGHHLRYSEESLKRVCQGEKVHVGRRATIERVKTEQEKQEYIAWSTRNCVVKFSDDGSVVKDLDELVKLVCEEEAIEHFHSKR
jgi:hypothetical protein